MIIQHITLLNSPIEEVLSTVNVLDMIRRLIEHRRGQLLNRSDELLLAHEARDVRAVLFNYLLFLDVPIPGGDRHLIAVRVVVYSLVDVVDVQELVLLRDIVFESGQLLLCRLWSALGCRYLDRDGRCLVLCDRWGSAYVTMGREDS